MNLALNLFLLTAASSYLAATYTKKGLIAHTKTLTTLALQSENTPPSIKEILTRLDLSRDRTDIWNIAVTALYKHPDQNRISKHHHTIEHLKFTHHLSVLLLVSSAVFALITIHNAL